VKTSQILSIACTLTAVFSSPAYTATYGGIEFPGGAESFADAVVSFVPGTGTGVAVNPPGPGVNGYAYNDPTNALGYPNLNNTRFFTSLGNGGELVLQFTDNYLTTSGDASADLHIFEQGNQIEQFYVAISTDGAAWIDLGLVTANPAPAGSIDIDGVAGVTPGGLYSYVRLIDSGTNSSLFPWAGADIDAVGAISTVVVPIPAAAWLFGTALLGLGALKRKKA